MQTSFPLSGRRAAKQSGNSTRAQQQPGGNPWTERATKRKWSGKFTTSLYVVCYALSANQPARGAERGLKLFALFLMFFFFNLLSRSCQLRSFRNYPRPRPLFGRAPEKEYTRYGHAASNARRPALRTLSQQGLSCSRGRPSPPPPTTRLEAENRTLGQVEGQKYKNSPFIVGSRALLSLKRPTLAPTEAFRTDRFVCKGATRLSNRERKYHYIL